MAATPHAAGAEPRHRKAKGKRAGSTRARPRNRRITRRIRPHRPYTAPPFSHPDSNDELATLRASIAELEGEQAAWLSKHGEDGNPWPQHDLLRDLRQALAHFEHAQLSQTAELAALEDVVAAWHQDRAEWMNEFGPDVPYPHHLTIFDAEDALDEGGQP